MKKIESVFGNKLDKLQNDNVYVESKVVSLKDITGMPTTSKFSKAIVSEGQIVNVISDAYGHLPNEQFFYEVESKMIDADVQYITRSINRNNRSFAVDYLLNDESYHVNVKSGSDKIIPMMRFTNAYDGSGPVSGFFGLFREVCSNRLMVAETQVGFKVRHKSTILEVVLPGIAAMVEKFMENEYYSLHKKFEVLAEQPISDLSKFVQEIAEEMELFKFAKSEKNPDTPSKNAEFVMDIINNEATKLGTKPNLWLGYNAFNEFIHASEKPFQKQKSLDGSLFNAVLEMA